MKNYSVDRVLSRDIYYPPFATLATMPHLPTLPILPIAAGDVLSSMHLKQSERSKFFCLDLRSDEEAASGTLPAELRVEGKLWKNTLLLEGVLKCLSEIQGCVICIVARGHPDHKNEETEYVNECGKLY